jgi:hypothetical protein
MRSSIKLRVLVITALTTTTIATGVVSPASAADRYDVGASASTASSAPVMAKPAQQQFSRHPGRRVAGPGRRLRGDVRDPTGVCHSGQAQPPQCAIGERGGRVPVVVCRQRRRPGFRVTY